MSMKNGVSGSGPRDRTNNSGVRIDSSVKDRMDGSGPSGGTDDFDTRVNQGVKDGVNSSQTRGRVGDSGMSVSVREDGVSSSRGRMNGLGKSMIDNPYIGNITSMGLLAILFSVVCVEVDTVGVS